MPQALPQALVVKSRRMINAAIIPDRQVIGILSAIAALNIMAANDQVQKPVPQPIGLMNGQVVDLLAVVPEGKD